MADIELAELLQCKLGIIIFFYELIVLIPLCFQLTIDSNVYRDISCQETHVLVPFSNGSSGALTSSFSKLHLQSEESYEVSAFLEQSEYWMR